MHTVMAGMVPDTAEVAGQYGCGQQGARGASASRRPALQQIIDGDEGTASDRRDTRTCDGLVEDESISVALENRARIEVRRSGCNDSIPKNAHHQVKDAGSEGAVEEDVIVPVLRNHVGDGKKGKAKQEREVDVSR